MLCKFTGGGPENGAKQELPDNIVEVKVVGLTPGYSEVYCRDPKRANRFVYQGQVANGPYVPGFMDDGRTWEEVCADAEANFDRTFGKE